MRSVNLAVMFAVSVISALSGAFNLLNGVKHYPNSLPLTMLLVGLSLISFAYALLLLKPAEKGSTGQWLILLLYAVSAVSGTVACGILGTLPYIMQSMDLSLTPALNHLSLPFLACAFLAVAPYVLAFVYLRRQSAALRLNAGQ
ncbi:hypothetical protein [Pseudomonas denitrificans (nom. rej.)]|uniref:Uncharacterized protein n=1 Tax=Pseudomonas denitrificans TaxID=43306 RepID=A0A9X7MZE7_PSEDE|nr:hypothetical protein [Pseudomonas denitrificans (nom. rej.)]QEY72090.1 hypothetical protein F1C79_10970 [Pseudomonas denitrificans (nom. rej.)]